MLRLRPLVLALVATAALAGTVSLPAASAPATGEPIEIPAVLTVTGLAAFLGSEQTQALTLIEGYVNRNGGIQGRPVKFKVYDEQSNPTVAVQVVTQALAESKSPVFVGPVLQASCNATAPLFKNGPVAFCIAPSDFPDAGSWRYSANPSVADDAAVILRYLRNRGFTKVALITATDAAGQVMDKSFADAFARPENKSLVQVLHDHFNYSDLSVAAQMAHVKAAQPQALIAWATGSPLALLLHGYRDAGLDIPFVTGNGAMTYVQMEQYKGFMPKELLFPGLPQQLLSADAVTTSRDPVLQARAVYATAFKSINVKPDYGQMLVWDCAMLAVDVLRKIGPNGTPAQAKAYLSQVHDWAGINGRYDFRNGRQRGVGLDAIAMDRWDETRDAFVAVTQPGGTMFSGAGR